MPNDDGAKRIAQWARGALARAGRPAEMPSTPRLNGLSVTRSGTTTTIELPRARIGCGQAILLGFLGAVSVAMLLAVGAAARNRMFDVSVTLLGIASLLLLGVAALSSHALAKERIVITPQSFCLYRRLVVRTSRKEMPLHALEHVVATDEGLRAYGRNTDIYFASVLTGVQREWLWTLVVATLANIESDPTGPGTP